MCGIIGYTGKDNAVPYLIGGLEKLEYRGYDSSGIAFFEKNKISLIKAEGQLQNLKKKTEGLVCTSFCGIGHTRWATHGKPDEVNAHPHQSCNKSFTIVHNGIIENYLSLKKELISEGFTFYSETDTEVIANLLEKLYTDDPLDALRHCTRLLEGTYALAVMCEDYPGKIFAAKKGSPLILAESERGSFISSDITALLSFTDEFLTLGDNETAVITKDNIAVFTPEGTEAEKKKEKVSWSVEQAEKQGYDHFMLKEIFEQPLVLKNTLSSFLSEEELFPELTQMKGELAETERVFFIGCGSAYHAGIAAKLLTEKLCKISASAEIASEFRYSDTPLSEKTLCVFISQSGETADTIAALFKAKKKKTKILSLVNVVGSTLARESDHVLYTKAGPEIAVATTKAYSSQLITLYLFCLLLAEVKGTISENEKKRLTDEISLLPDKAEELLFSAEKKIKDLVPLFKSSADGYFIGRGFDYPAAVEGSLKMKEISYIPTQAYPAGELKHGTISLIEKGTPVVALCCQEELFKKMLSAVKEVKSRGARVLIITKESFRRELSDEENLLILPDTDELFCTLLQVCALQLLSYYTAKEKNLEIDKPRNLAKSVTVE